MNEYFSKRNLETADNCIRAMFAFDTQPDEFISTEYDKGFKEYFNNFEATRSWNNTLIEWFATVAIALADETELEIVSNADYRIKRLKVICGVAQLVEIL
jgi:hypothetical protein